jgi:hypothetical protein
VFHYNILLASLAIDHFSEDSNSIFQQLPGYQPQLRSKQASSSLLLAFASMVILGVEPHRDP